MPINQLVTETDRQTDNVQFLHDVLMGLGAEQKQLPSKYFYDSKGDMLFQQLMAHPAYYLTDCELEIFTRQTRQLAKTISSAGNPFDLIELGVGDATKSVYLLQELITQGIGYHYIPVDISSNIIHQLEKKLPLMVPGLKMTGFNGEYFKVLEKKCIGSERPKVILFLGANIGNMYPKEATGFLKTLRSHLKKGDISLIGFDLKKHPRIIRLAYDDPNGITARFNLNLLERINRELGADFPLDQFDHYCSYDPESGACKSYLICLNEMTVTVDQHKFFFKKDEYIWTEISQKYTISEIDSMAAECGFKPLKHIKDSKNWFTDAVWEAV